MSKITVNEELIDKLANLSKLALSKEEKLKLIPNIQGILDQMQILDKIDLSDVEPMHTIAPHNLSLRDDSPENPLPKNDALKNAPQTDGQYFKVKKK